VFLFTFTSFGVILILGGPRYATLETEIYRQTAQLLNLPLAAATKKQYDRMVKEGLGELDKSGIAELTFKGRHRAKKK